MVNEVLMNGEPDKIIKIILEERCIFNGISNDCIKDSYLFWGWLVCKKDNTFVVNFQDGGRGGLPDYIQISEEDYLLAIAEKLNGDYMSRKYAYPIQEQKRLDSKKGT